MDDLEYIVKDALMMCDQSDTPMFFSPTYSQVTNTKIQKLFIATTDDATPITHIPSFLLCKKTQKPCMPGTSPGAWKDPWPIKIKDKQALIGRCTCPCTLGGTIEFITSGQIPLDDETKKEIEEMQEDGQRELDDMGYGNSVGECGFVEGMIPIWGSGKDMINDIQTGDVGGAILNGVFLIWDAASVVAGIFSFGSGTAAMQGAKGGLKTTIKSFGKKILGGAKSAGKWIKGLFKSSADDVAEVTVKKTLKETAEAGAGALKKELDDVAKKIPKDKKTVKAKEKPVSYERPSHFRKGKKDKVWETAKREGDGKVIDPTKQIEIKETDKWDMGHKPGYEFRKHQKSAKERGISRKQFLDEYNNPDHYRPELPSSNRSHKGEDLTDTYLGP